MATDATYELCLPVLEDDGLDEEDKTEKIESLLRTGTTLESDQLQNAVLNILWRYRNGKSQAKSTRITHHAVVRSSSPSPWSPNVLRSASPSTNAGSPNLAKASPTIPPGFQPSYVRSKSFGTASPFGSPRPSPRLAFAAPIPHSPSLSNYEFSDGNTERTDYGDYGSDTVEWLVKDDATSRPSSSGAGSNSEHSWNVAAAPFIQSQPSEMSAYDMLRSVLGDGKTDEEIEAALDANGYDLSATLMNLMGASGMPQDTNSYSGKEGVLIGKSMAPSQPIAINSPPKSRHAVVCKYFLASGSCLRADCRFSHDVGGHICKYWLAGNCLAGESCIFSHDPSLLMQRMNFGDEQQPSNPPTGEIDDFPTLNAPVHTPLIPSSPGSRLATSPRKQYLSNGSPVSRPVSRHRSPQPAFLDDKDAFPTLGAAGPRGSNSKKHHGKRGQSSESSPNSLADVVRMAPGPSMTALRKTLPKLKAAANKESKIPAPQRIPWLETGARANQEYLAARTEAFKHGSLRNKFLQSAAQAWHRSDARAAKALSLRGQSENELMRKCHREAARVLFEQRNKNHLSEENESYVDLHGLHPEEAIEYVQQALQQHRKGEQGVLYVVIGTGHHSKQGKDKIGKAVKAWLGEGGYVSREFGMGGESVGGGILGVDVGSGTSPSISQTEKG